MKMIEWPPYTCVATFVYESLKHFGFLYPQPFIAENIGIKVPVGIRNPFNLQQTNNESEFGLSAFSAKAMINKLLTDLNTDFNFFHIPFNTIPYKMYEEQCDLFLQGEFKLGIGYNYSNFENNDHINRHISFLAKRDDYFCFLEDYYISLEVTKMQVLCSELKNAVLAINDGFWIIGKKEQILRKIL